jgi:hypothetical protein
MKPVAYSLLLPSLLVGCVATHKVALPSFSYNGKPHNNLIINRNPQYGDGQPDGCIIMSELSLSLTQASGDSILAVVREAGTGKVIPYANIRVFPKQIADTILLTRNAQNGFFMLRSWQVKRMEVSTIGYRTLVVDCTTKSLF